MPLVTCSRSGENNVSARNNRLVNYRARFDGSILTSQNGDTLQGIPSCRPSHRDKRTASIPDSERTFSGDSDRIGIRFGNDRSPRNGERDMTSSSATLAAFAADLRYEDIPSSGHRARERAFPRLGSVLRLPERMRVRSSPSKAWLKRWDLLVEAPSS